MDYLSGTGGLVFGAAGILTAFTYYGSLQEYVFDYRDDKGHAFVYVWLLQTIEALANTVVGFLGMMMSGRAVGMPLRYFALSGATQVFAKASMSFAMSFGLAFAIATLAKSAKMAPVMLGGIFIGGKRYPLRQYFQVAAIIMATILVSMASKKGGGGATTTLSGILLICLSLMFDGLTGGVQDRVKAKCKECNVKVGSFDMMFWTNLFMLLVAMVFAVVTPTQAGSVQMLEGISFIAANIQIMWKILAFAACSAFGQCFIFYVVANFGALKCSTVTTTRKIFSVLFSIFTKGYVLAPLGWFGILLGTLGIIGELIPENEKPHQEKRQVTPVEPCQPPIEKNPSVASELAHTPSTSAMHLSDTNLTTPMVTDESSRV